MRFGTKALLAILILGSASISYCEGAPPDRKITHLTSTYCEGPGTLPTWPNKSVGFHIEHREGGGTQPTWPK